MKNDTVPTQVELDNWTRQILDWFRETGRKYLGKELREDLAERGAKWITPDGDLTPEALKSLNKHILGDLVVMDVMDVE